MLKATVIDGCITVENISKPSEDTSKTTSDNTSEKGTSSIDSNDTTSKDDNTSTDSSDSSSNEESKNDTNPATGVPFAFVVAFVPVTAIVVARKRKNK